MFHAHYSLMFKATLTVQDSGYRYKERGLDPKVGAEARLFLWAETVGVPPLALTCGQPASHTHCALVPGETDQQRGALAQRSCHEAWEPAKRATGVGRGWVSPFPSSPASCPHTVHTQPAPSPSPGHATACSVFPTEKSGDHVLKAHDTGPRQLLP